MDEILTFWTYEDLFGEISDTILNSKEKDLDSLISDLCSEIHTSRAIFYSSFLNMVYQTEDTDCITKLVATEIHNLDIKPKIMKNRILFHRSNLLYAISVLIQKGVNKNLEIDTQPSKQDRINFNKTLALINSEINSVSGMEPGNLIKFYLLRDHPYSYSPNDTLDFYGRWLTRYWHIYNELLHSLPEKRKDKLIIAIDTLEKINGVTLDIHFKVITSLFFWFLYLPNKQSIPKDKRIKGFNKTNTRTFCINSNNWSTGSNLIKIINKMSKCKKGFDQHFIESKKEDFDKGRVYDPYYQNIVKFFDYPIFKIDEKHFCILDLKFLIEGVCSGFLSKLIKLPESNIKAITSQYGYLLEKYFQNLLKNIFRNRTIPDGDGEPDAIIECGEYIVVFEFTVEYYRISALYNSNIDEFYEDLNKILFNPGKSGQKIRDKKSPGKFINLNNYVKNHENKFKDKKIIPILVTEKYIGDYSLLENFNNHLSQKINELHLEHLKQRAPFIICLDDLEFYWSVSNSKKNDNQAEDFINCLLEWEKFTEKGRLHYNFYFFLKKYFGSVLDEDFTNEEYAKFLDIEALLNRCK